MFGKYFHWWKMDLKHLSFNISIVKINVVDIFINKINNLRSDTKKTENQIFQLNGLQI